MGKAPAFWVVIIILLGFSKIGNTTAYTYELSENQTWANNNLENNPSSVTVRTYIPGSHSTIFREISLYTPTYTSNTNSLGDNVGSVFNTYGSGTTAFINPYNAPVRTIIYPAPQILHTTLLSINNNRLAVGTYYVLGGQASGKGFIYDVTTDQYTLLDAPNTEWTDAADINNAGQIVGASINDSGAIRKGFTYDCLNGFEAFDIPGSTWTIPKKIDDEGNIYGIVSGIANANYFIARPETVNSNLSCSLVPRNDVATPLTFADSTSLELSGDFVLGVKIGDFDAGGVNDLLINHAPGKTILYLGEDNFNSKIRYSGDEFNTLAEGINIATEWDFNNDGLIDKTKSNGQDNLLYLAKQDGSGYHYVPQTLPAGDLKYGDLNGDGLVDLIQFNDAFASISYQTESVVVEPAPVAASLLSPSGVMNQAQINFTWNSVANSTDYYLWIVDLATGSPLTPRWYSASESGCGNGEPVCTLPSASNLPAGQYQWMVLDRNIAGNGLWSPPMRFSVGATPDATILVGVTTGTEITYSWNAVANASDYFLWVINTATGQALSPRWYSASELGCNNSESTCSLTSTATLSASQYRWMVLTKNAAGNGAWSSPMQFSIGSTPGATILSGVTSNSSTSNQPTYSWDAVANASDYFLWVVDTSTGQPLAPKWYTATEVGCGNSEPSCSLTVANTLPAGQYRWMILTKNNSGNGAWSTAMLFSISSSASVISSL